MDVFELQAGLVDPANELGECARGAAGIDGERFAVVAAQMAFDGFEAGDFGRHGLCGGYFHSRLAKGLLLDVAGRAEGDDLALVDDGDAIAESFGLFDVVRGQQDGALGVAELLDDCVDFNADLRVEASRRFVEENHLGFVDHGEG
jgi:nucleotide-binding universal stress UspA family protein